MIKQYIKQSIQMLKENRLVSVISIAGTAISISYDYGGSPGVPDTVRQLLIPENKPRPDDVCG